MNLRQPLIRNIWAVGRNYGSHARELGNQIPSPEAEPMIFLKAGSTIVENGTTFSLPDFSQDIHHECEVAVRFGPNGQFTEISVALDLTARDLQSRLKAQGHPWTLAKSFRDSCPLGPLIPIPPAADLQNLDFELRVNGELRQVGATRDMIHSIEKLRIYVLSRFPVLEGDLLLTGTPAGVAQLMPGDQLQAEIKGFVQAQWKIQS
jgi:2-keto-4-pentenoate hydratase/2-oxohepta-3-ene-1,7-dioic acid hydratase in catechol pathway